MFHFPGFPPPALYIQAGVTPHHGCRVPPFGHPRINARLTAPRGLSRPPTSFIGSWYQGIHHAPLHTYTPPAHTARALHTAFGTHQEKSTHTTQPPHPTPPHEEEKQSRRLLMLASTIQFTNTHPQPATPAPTPPPRTHPRPGNPAHARPQRPRQEKDGCYGAATGPDPAETTHPTPHTPRPAARMRRERTETAGGPVPSGPNSAPTPHPPPPAPRRSRQGTRERQERRRFAMFH